MKQPHKKPTKYKELSKPPWALLQPSIWTRSGIKASCNPCPVIRMATPNSMVESRKIDAINAQPLD